MQNGSGGGLLGAEFDPFVMPAAGKPPANTGLTTREERFERRLGLLARLESDFAKQAAGEVADHQKLYRKAARMIESPHMQAFDLDLEPEAIRQAYGSSPFASGCLLARWLVEAGVTFVEVVSDGWDTHADNFATTARLAANVDQPFAALLADLESRGMLANTVVAWMGGVRPHAEDQSGLRRPRSFSPRVQRGPGRRRRAGRTGDRQDRFRRNRSHRVAHRRGRPVPLAGQRAEARPDQGKHEQHRPADQAG